jgi:hypothetical protein
MTYPQAARAVWLYRIIGGTVVVLGLTWLLISVFMWAFYLPAQNAIEGAVFRGMRQIIATAYQVSSPYIGFIWKNPIPFNGQFADIFANKWMYLVYGLVLLGVDRISAAKKLSTMIQQAKHTLAQHQMNASVAAHHGYAQTALPNQQQGTNPPPPPPQISPPAWFSTMHTLYIAPIVVGILLFVVQKIFT